MISRKVRLAGGPADGEFAYAPDHIREGDTFSVPVVEGLGMVLSADHTPPDFVKAHVHYYRLCVIHQHKDRVFLYGVPEHHKPEDGLIAMFGQPTYVW